MCFYENGKYFGMTARCREVVQIYWGHTITWTPQSQMEFLIYNEVTAQI